MVTCVSTIVPENVSRVLSLSRSQSSETKDHAIYVLRHVRMTDGVIDRGALIQIVPQARAYALGMFAQDRAPGLCFGAISL